MSLKRSLCTLGCTPTEARLVSLRVRELIVDSTGYEIFADVEPALRRLSEAGWIQAVVSNHIPELAHLLVNLGLAQYFARVYTSALVGYEKPHMGFLGRVLDDGPWPAPIWVVGDSVEEALELAHEMRLPLGAIRQPGREALVRYTATHERRIRCARETNVCSG